METEKGGRRRGADGRSWRRRIFIERDPGKEVLEEEEIDLDQQEEGEGGGSDRGRGNIRDLIHEKSTFLLLSFLHR